MQTTTLQRNRALHTALLVLLLSAVGMGKGYAQEYDFSAVCETGQTLYYNIIGTNQVEMTSPTGMGWYGFEEPTGDIVLPESVQFEGTNYTVTSIGSYAFMDCRELTGSLAIPNSVTTIGFLAFSSCTGLTSLFIPQSVTSIGFDIYTNSTSSFPGCGFEQIIVDLNNPVYDSRDNCNAIIETNSNMLLMACNTTTIPNTITAIAAEAFSGCTGLNGGLVIPNSISTIGPYAFAGCTGLTGDLVIPNSVTTIGEGAFAGCTGLTGTLTLPNSITEIKDWVFASCGFSGNLVIPNSVTSIGSNAFIFCTGFTGHLVIPNSITIIKGSTFEGCIGITSVYLPQSILKISKAAFASCTGLTGDLVLPDYVIAIGASAFEGCTSITGVTIGKFIQGVGDGAFHHCPSIESVTILATQLPELYGGGDVFGFYNDPRIAMLRVPCGYKALYEEWGCANEFSTIIEDCDSHTININNTNSNGGSVSLSSNSANLGDEVQITVTPNTGMSLSLLTVCNANDPSQTVPVYPIGKASSTYGFTMPYYDVTIKAVFTHGNAVGEGNSIAASVYPNPTNGQVKIEAEDLKRITISDMLGQVIYDGEAMGDVFEYDFSNNEAGVYLVRIETASGIVVKKVSVAR